VLRIRISSFNIILDMVPVPAKKGSQLLRAKSRNQ